jgi:tripartite-type tricarboxylate transporter receptor subunit TctC
MQASYRLHARSTMRLARHDWCLSERSNTIGASLGTEDEIMRFIKIGVTALGAGLAVVAAIQSVAAQATFPSKNVRIVVPYPAGGGTDILARLLADQLSRLWKQNVVVENVGGAAGNIGAADVARATPDGHTLLVSSPGPVSTNKFLYKDMPYDPAQWTAVALLATGPYVLSIRKNFPGSTVKDVVTYAKANPGKLTAAIPGAGSVGHLATVELEMLAGIKTLHVPYKGLGPALNDVIAGHVDLMFDTPTTSLPLNKDGKIKTIATGTPERISEAPDIPTIAETLPGYRAVTWYAMVAPPKTPAAIADKINRDVVAILSRKEVADKVHSIQMDAATKSRSETAKFFADEAELWGKVIKSANIPLQ